LHLREPRLLASLNDRLCGRERVWAWREFDGDDAGDVVTH
jgi:hypothetical protein